MLVVKFWVLERDFFAWIQFFCKKSLHNVLLVAEWRGVQQICIGKHKMERNITNLHIELMC